MTLEVADLEQLDKKKVYTIASYTGTLTGSFSAINLDYPWHLILGAPAGAVKISTYKGTLILFK